MLFHLLKPKDACHQVLLNYASGPDLVLFRVVLCSPVVCFLWSGPKNSQFLKNKTKRRHPVSHVERQWSAAVTSPPSQTPIFRGKSKLQSLFWWQISSHVALHCSGQLYLSSLVVVWSLQRHFQIQASIKTVLHLMLRESDEEETTFHVVEQWGSCCSFQEGQAGYYFSEGRV